MLARIRASYALQALAFSAAMLGCLFLMGAVRTSAGASFAPQGGLGFPILACALSGVAFAGLIFLFNTLFTRFPKTKTPVTVIIALLFLWFTCLQPIFMGKPRHSNDTPPPASHGALATVGMPLASGHFAMPMPVAGPSSS